LVYELGSDHRCRIERWSIVVVSHAEHARLVEDLRAARLRIRLHVQVVALVERVVACLLMAHFVVILLLLLLLLIV